MSFLRYRDFSTPDWIYVYLVGSDDDFYYHLLPLTYIWLEHINQLERISEVMPDSTNANFFTHEYINRDRIYLPRDLYMLSFTVENDEVKYLNRLTHFFKDISTFSRKGSFESIETAFLLSKNYLPTDLKKRLLNFLCEKHKDIRFKLKSSPEIQHHIYFAN